MLILICLIISVKITIVINYDAHVTSVIDQFVLINFYLFTFFDFFEIIDWVNEVIVLDTSLDEVEVEYNLEDVPNDCLLHVQNVEIVVQRINIRVKRIRENVRRIEVMVDNVVVVISSNLVSTTFRNDSN